MADNGDLNDVTVVQLEDEGGAPRAVPQDAVFRTVPKDHTTFLVWRITVSKPYDFFILRYP